jgi:hypothetical protein
MEEDYELLNCNIVARVLQIMETLISCLSNCYIDQTNSQSSNEQPQLDHETEHGMCLLNRCLVIISNMAAQVPDARKEILKFKMMDLICKAF